MDQVVRTGRCTCCGRPWRLLDLREGGHVLCRACQPHAGNPLQEVRDHRDMWTGLLAEIQAAHIAAVQRLDERLRELQSQLENRPVREVERTINEEAFAEVREDMERAFRQRDAVYGLVLELLLVHRLDEDGAQCRCGKSAKDCEVATILEDYRAMVRGWERKQIELFRDGQRHRLPPNHPTVLDRRIGADTGAIA